MAVYEGKPVSYTISINESQRLMLIEALVAKHGVKPPKWDLSKEDEPHATRVLLHSIDDAELEQPGAIHGLCV